ncbi:hypothetical protein PHYPSEUDO_013081 [Phytophthora pseudosyringae]|uniref:Uncharacterized protein n=1 Tax=Phytophthora pseudosyringae TaxID=221518 RepID=A0A8T1W490_9STRA|nr:hypothetical protein PHYPSEUDO_013081 [Phytophthora pseudosyringae]
MADAIMTLLEQNPTTGIAVGGALVAAAVGLTAAKALGGKAAPAEATAAPKKKKSKSKSKKKTPAAVPADKENASSDINLEEFVDDGPDSEEEEAMRAEKRKLKLKQKKKNAKAKQRAAATSSGKPAVDTDKEKDKKKAAVDALQKDAEDGWETVVSKKKTAKPKQQ